MIDREKIIQTRKAEITSLQKEQTKLLKAAQKLGKLPPCKRLQNGLNRFLRIAQLVMRAQMLQAQIHIIMSQPIPLREFPPGGSQNCQTGEMKHEIITSK